MSTVYETTVDTLREVGERLAHVEMPSSIPSVRVPSVRIPASVSDVVSDWPDDIVDRVADGGRTLRRQPWLVAGGAIVLIVMVAWLVRRRRSDDTESRLSTADGSRTAGAA